MITKHNDKDLVTYNAEQWQINLLKLNPSYTCWGNGQDSMCEADGWSGSKVVDNVKSLYPLDDLNELAHFYFFVGRDSENCQVCDGRGYSAFAMKEKRSIPAQITLSKNDVLDLFSDERLRAEDGKYYALKNEKWYTRVKVGNKFLLRRCPDPVIPTHHKQMFIDCISEHVLLKARAKRAGQELLCSTCQGKGYNFTTEKSHIGFQTWILHPRKGCSKGVLLPKFAEEDVPAIMEYLKSGKKRAKKMFSKIG